MEVALPMYLRMGFLKHAELPPIAGAAYARYVLALEAPPGVPLQGAATP
jgi:hypothetical protein